MQSAMSMVDLNDVDKLVRDGLTLKEIAADYGVNYNTLRRERSEWLLTQRYPQTILEPSHRYGLSEQFQREEQKRRTGPMDKDAIQRRYAIDKEQYNLPDDTSVYERHVAALPEHAVAVLSPDVHVGEMDGKDQHDPWNMELHLEIIRDVPKVDIIYTGNDLCDFPTISRWSDKFGYNSLRAIDQIRKPVTTWLNDLGEAAPEAMKVYVAGNHDVRIYEHTDKLAPEETEDILKQFIPMIRKTGTLWFDFNKERRFRAKAMVHVHGLYAGKYMAEKHAARFSFQEDVMHAHTHRFQVHSTRGERRGSSTTTISSGCLCSLEPHYMTSPDWQNGFVIAHLFEDKTLFEPIEFHNYQAVYGGKLYKVRRWK